MPAEGPVPPLVVPHRVDPYIPQAWADSDMMSRVRADSPTREGIEELVERGRLLQQAAIRRGVRRLGRAVAEYLVETLLIGAGLGIFVAIAWVYAA